jgi:hypothetical protein
MASERPLHPNLPFLPFSFPSACSPHVLMPRNASLNDPEAGFRRHQLGGRVQQWLACKLMSDAVPDSLCMNCVLSMNNCCKTNNVWADIGATRPNHGQNRTLQWHRLVQSDTVILATVIWTVLYGAFAVDTVITVQNPTLRRKCTGLTVNLRFARHLIFLDVDLPIYNFGKTFDAHGWHSIGGGYCRDWRPTTKFKNN